MKTPESFEKADVDKYLKTVGAYNVKTASFGYGGSGTADRICCIAGQFWSLEVKREGKEPTPIQWKRIKEVEVAGGKTAWGVATKIITEIETWRRINGLVAPNALQESAAAKRR